MLRRTCGNLNVLKKIYANVKYTARSNERMTTYNPNYTNNKRDIMQKIINAR